MTTAYAYVYECCLLLCLLFGRATWARRKKGEGGREKKEKGTVSQPGLGAHNWAVYNYLYSHMSIYELASCSNALDSIHRRMGVARQRGCTSAGPRKKVE